MYYVITTNHPPLPPCIEYDSNPASGTSANPTPEAVALGVFFGLFLFLRLACLVRCLTCHTDRISISTLKNNNNQELTNPSPRKTMSLTHTTHAFISAISSAFFVELELLLFTVFLRCCSSSSITCSLLFRGLFVRVNDSFFCHRDPCPPLPPPSLSRLEKKAGVASTKHQVAWLARASFFSFSYCTVLYYTW